jgi:5-methylcytosine-specific restriction endonuclease McrA
MSRSLDNWMPEMMRAYVAKAISKTREIKCEECGTYENLEFHHKKYSTEENATIKDIKILCTKCHRNAKASKRRGSGLRTIFENGKRFCEVSKFRFEY